MTWRVATRHWRIYIEAKEAMLGGPLTQGAPQINKINKWLRNNDNAERN